MVDVLVGTEPKPTRWRLHKQLLTSNSAIIKASFTHPCKENSEGHIRFPEDGSAIFALFAHFVYVHDIYLCSCDELLKAYVLADPLSAPAFQRVVFERIFDTF